MSRLLVLGGGPAGLGAAWWAARAGHDVLLLERGAAFGGLAASFEVAGVRVDHGSHRLHHATDPALLTELHGLLGDDLQVRPRRGRIRLGGRWVPFPLTPAGVATNLPPGFAAAASWDAVTGWARRQRDDTFAEVVRAGLGPTMLERFYGPYARKLWGREPDDLAGEQARRRIAAGGVGAVVRKVLAGSDPAARTFLYPRRGFGQIAEALADAARSAGAELRTGAEVTGLRAAPDGVEVCLADGALLDADHVLSTVPLPALARIGDAPTEVADAARGLATRSMVLVYLVVPQPRFTRFDAHYLPEAFTPITRISEPKNYRDGDDPPDRTVLCAELPCAVDDAHWAASDDELAAVTLAAIRDAGLPVPEVADVETRRIGSVYPIYDRGFEARLATVDAWASALPRVTTLGRQGLFVHDNTHHTLAMARAAVDALDADGRRDEAAWASSRAAFAAHVVED